MKRVTRSTYANAQSSRSHTIFSIMIETTEGNFTRKAKLNLCDLAGSEKINKDEVINQKHMTELKTINLSLTTLGKIISFLAKTKKKVPHIPFRDSKLTRILQNSLGGNCNTVILGTISPGMRDIDESLSTLKFADRAK
jgi:hypothetical protein